jgi:nitrate reductase gamma subunit
VFFGGLGYRLVSWNSTKRAVASFTVYPKPGGLSKIGSLAADETILPRLARWNKRLWASAILLHFSILLLFLGHLRLFYEPTWLWSAFGLDEAGVQALAFYSGALAGVLFLVALLTLTSRRSMGIIRRISVPEDYLILALLISIALTGLYMRFASQLDIGGLRIYMTSLVLIHPSLNAEILQPTFVIHFSLVQGFLIFFPFSKLTHAIGSFMTNYWVKG